MKKAYEVSYTPCIRTGLTEIAKAMGVCRPTVKKWIEQGAPISMDGEGCNRIYMTEIAALWQWKLAHSRKSMSQA